MKRQLILFAVCTCLAASLTAQEPPAYGTALSGRDYGGYPFGGYAPQTYPPPYGYPIYPTYRPVYPRPMRPPATPNPADGKPYGSPPHDVAEPTSPEPATASPSHDQTPTPAPTYRSPESTADQEMNYRFRPLEERTADEPPPNSEPPGEPASGWGKAAPAFPEPVSAINRDNAAAKPPAPAGMPQARMPFPQAEQQPPAAPLQEESKLKFRPLDKPGYSSDLEE